MITITAVVQVDGNRLTGFMNGKDAEGSVYSRQIDVNTDTDPARLTDPWRIVVFISTGVHEVARSIQGHSANLGAHGWVSPYSKDGLFVFEFDYDGDHGWDEPTKSIVPPHGTNRSIMEA